MNVIILVQTVFWTKLYRTFFCVCVPLQTIVIYITIAETHIWNLFVRLPSILSELHPSETQSLCWWIERCGGLIWSCCPRNPLGKVGEEKRRKLLSIVQLMASCIGLTFVLQDSRICLFFYKVNLNKLLILTIFRFGLIASFFSYTMCTMCTL